MILQNVAMFAWGTNVKQFPSLFKTATVNVLGYSIVPENLLALGVGVVCMLALHFFMTRSKFGDLHARRGPGRARREAPWASTCP